MTRLRTHRPYHLVNCGATTQHVAALIISRADHGSSSSAVSHAVPVRRYEAVIKFLDRNDLLGVIRGHEAQDAGYVQSSDSISVANPP